MLQYHQILEVASWTAETYPQGNRSRGMLLVKAAPLLCVEI